MRVLPLRVSTRWRWWLEGRRSTAHRSREATSDPSPLVLLVLAKDGRYDDAVALRLEQRGRARRLVLARHEQGQNAAAFRGEVVHLEVLDVDPLGAEGLRDPAEHARPVGDVDAHALESARVRVGV